jgi:hypothetical protein
MVKVKSIDLGALQDQFTAAKKQYDTDVKALVKAQDAVDRSRRAFLEAEQTLKEGTRTVLG